MPRTQLSTTGYKYLRDRFLAVHCWIRMSRLVASLCAATWLSSVPAAETAPSSDAHAAPASTNGSPTFKVLSYKVSAPTLPSLESLSAALAKSTGTNVSLEDVVKAAASVQAAYQKRGYSNIIVGIPTNQTPEGVLVMNVFQGASPQILISGWRFSGFSALPTNTIAMALTNNPPPLATNREPKFVVTSYETLGNSLLSTQTLAAIFTNYIGTNIGVSDILKAGSALQMEYRTRGFPTVNVTIPPQQITNGIVRLRVFEGRLAQINVVNNRFFSSNNVMRALPSLETNIILPGQVFQAELDRANANQDRQIYPQLGPGPSEGTTTLDLKVKDRLPLHAKAEFNNQSSPGTPELRLNTSAVYDNLWQYEHSLGVQYSFSPEAYKSGDQWAFYDKPLVVNYSAFYRLPLGAPESLSRTITSQPGTFGFSEATRQFQLPPPTGRPELNIFASRSTIDTGLEALQTQLLYDVPGVRRVTRQDVQQDITVNEDLGFRFNVPMQATEKTRATVSGGLDYKTYSLTSAKTNNFSFTEITVNANGSVNPPIISTVPSPVPTTHAPLDYLPLSFRYDDTLRDKLGATSFGLGVNLNVWYSGSLSNLHRITGSFQSSGNWVAFTPSLSRDLIIATNWVLTLRLDGQWASEPLISTERFGAGGVNSVRGYREGEVFGDTGWKLNVEQKTPSYVVGMAYDRAPLTVRGAVFMDYADVWLLDPLFAKSHVALWGTGFGGVMSVGTHWEARLLFSWPLLTAGTTEAYVPRFNFSLSSQF